MREGTTTMNQMLTPYLTILAVASGFAALVIAGITLLPHPLPDAVRIAALLFPPAFLILFLLFYRQPGTLDSRFFLREAFHERLRRLGHRLRRGARG